MSTLLEDNAKTYANHLYSVRDIYYEIFQNPEYDGYVWGGRIRSYLMRNKIIASCKLQDKDLPNILVNGYELEKEQIDECRDYLKTFKEFSSYAKTASGDTEEQVLINSIRGLESLSVTQRKLQGNYSLTDIANMKLRLLKGGKINSVEEKVEIKDTEVNKVQEDATEHTKFYIWKPVYCVELDKTFKSASEASKELNIDVSGILRCCYGTRKSSRGYHFIYDKDRKEKQTDNFIDEKTMREIAQEVFNTDEIGPRQTALVQHYIIKESKACGQKLITGSNGNTRKMNVYNVTKEQIDGGREVIKTKYPELFINYKKGNVISEPIAVANEESNITYLEDKQNNTATIDSQNKSNLYLICLQTIIQLIVNLTLVIIYISYLIK